MNDNDNKKYEELQEKIIRWIKEEGGNEDWNISNLKKHLRKSSKEMELKYMFQKEEIKILKESITILKNKIDNLAEQLLMTRRKLTNEEVNWDSILNDSPYKDDFSERQKERISHQHSNFSKIVELLSILKYKY